MPKSKFIFSITFLICSICLTSFILVSEPQFVVNEKKSEFLEGISTSDIGPTISIEDSLWGGNYTWSEAVTEGFCHGLGTFSDPYIIEDIDLNGGYITIRNSNKYLVINNCQFFNSNTQAAISLSSVENYQIINCEFLGNSNGLSLEDCHHGEISNNLFLNNTNRGIALYNTTSNSIIQNQISYNYQGIYLTQSVDNLISRNSMFNNLEMGIFLNYGDNNDVKLNQIYYSSEGIRTYFSYYNSITGNSIDNNNVGIHLTWSYYNSITANSINDNDVGIHLTWSNHNWIIGNIFRGNTNNTIEEHSPNNTFESESGNSLPLEVLLFISLGLIILSSIFAMKYRKSKKKSTRTSEFKEPIKLIKDKPKPTLTLRSSEDIPTTEIISKTIEEATYKCNFCGETVNLPAKFCHQCGQNVIIQHINNLKVNYCRYCGTKFTREASFCFDCGKSVSK